MSRRVACFLVRHIWLVERKDIILIIKYCSPPTWLAANLYVCLHNFFGAEELTLCDNGLDGSIPTDVGVLLTSLSKCSKQTLFVCCQQPLILLVNRSHTHFGFKSIHCSQHDSLFVITTLLELYHLRLIT